MTKLEKLHEEKYFLKYIIHKEYYYFLRNELSKYTQHGNTSIFKHSKIVAFNSYVVGNFFEKRFNAKIDFDSLISAAYMHDMFMYDWHQKANWHKLHGFTHPKLAALNAKNYCNATPKEQKIIETHMWPLTLTKIPTCKEGWILSISDKITTLMEVFGK